MNKLITKCKKGTNEYNYINFIYYINKSYVSEIKIYYYIITVLDFRYIFYLLK